MVFEGRPSPGERWVVPIGILLGDSGNPFWSAMKAEYERVAPGLGLRPTHVWAQPEKDPAAQLEAFRGMLGGGFSAFVVNPLDQRNLVPGILAAAAAGLPVFDVGGKTDAEAVAAAGPLYVPVPTVDFWEQGRMAGRYLVERLRERSGSVGGDEREMTVAIVEGRPESKQSIGRSGGAAEILGGFPGIKIVARVPGHFDRERARAVAEAIRRDHPGIDAFFCANDLMALGASEAVDAAVSTTAGGAASPARHPIIVGVDGTDEAKAAVASGSIDATVAFSPADVAVVILGAVRAVLDGGEPPRHATVTSRLFTQRTVLLQELAQAVVSMDGPRARTAAGVALARGMDAATVVEQGLMPGMEEVGRRYEAYEYFVPELLMAGDAMTAALEVLRPSTTTEDEEHAANERGRGTVVLGVAEGDIHEIGKNLVKITLQAAGYRVVDLGRDVSAERFVQAVEEHGAQVLAISALMTTTMIRMEDVVAALEAAGLKDRVRVLVGGAPLSAEFARTIRADAYSPTATTAVEDVRKLVEEVTG